MSAISRRGALSGAATAGLGLPLLAACGDDGGDGGGSAGSASDPASRPTSSAAPQPSEPPTSDPAEATTTAPAGDGIPTSDVPVGGGIIEGETVITQPAEGEFKAFSATCTHQGCLVGTVEDGTINCPCHGSRFSIEDGSVASGPATAPLAEVGLTVDGDRITLG